MKTVPTVRLADTIDAAALPELPEEIALAMTDIADAAREGLMAMSVAAGMAVMAAMFEAEITEIAGPKGKHNPDRAAVRHGAEKGSVTLGGRRVPVERPRARTVEGHEVPLTSYAHFAADDLLTQVVMERMAAGVATRRHARTAEPVGEKVSGTQKSTSKSAISRRFVKQTETALAELMSRDLAGEDIKVLMLDGEHMAGRCVVVALAITADGTKKPVGLWDGSTENKTVVCSLLADLVERGLRFDDGLLVVCDGAKALAAAVREVFGAKAAIQRCTLHKRRNVADHLPDKEQAWVDAKLVKAFGHPDPHTGLANAKSLAAQLEKNYPGAAASLREGLDEMFTVARLGIDGRLAKTLTTSNPVESMISIARTTNRNVTRWRDGQMVLRWTAAGMLNAERAFRRIKGHKQMPQLVAALHRHAHPKTAAGTEAVGAAA
ncbi:MULTISPECIES: IS256 family transposase [Mycolicibacterium]|jgi:putative transposase|uniref:IS256 family transposase n=2 Tax=Mycobacteriaceae TaxID=1762 RepID=UPI00055DCB89|nr:MULTISPECIES: IS256 family transposase [Mycolicibacterium]UJL26417.1 IS256 family transposase [Mycolicibacterium vanbaalenii]UJL26841.1 IS256 family transposase [Mycolicibacterium vanbaalenii]UJL26914.1 IS256 family transposase [Mycolicibacterium vanbaalenii]UJL27371.1 IS256 family transposase [Mycolicibacterium vanbaalenii]UJL30134.1 IS256 family transposase [Mycolicibacterium vanbaalenii]